MISPSGLARRLEAALKKLLAQDGDLFQCAIDGTDRISRKLHEVCVNHQLANHLKDSLDPRFSREKLFYDIEFNKRGQEDKKLTVDGRQKSVRPDIVIHNRLNNDRKLNLLVIECKMATTRHKRIEWDRKKLLAFMQDDRFQYQYGLQVIYDTGRITAELYSRIGSKIEPKPITITR